MFSENIFLPQRNAVIMKRNAIDFEKWDYLCGGTLISSEFVVTGKFSHAFILHIAYFCHFNPSFIRCRMHPL